MARTNAMLLVVLGSAVAAVAAAPVQQTAETVHGGPPGGASLFRNYCASCHGAEARGDGPLANSLRSIPPDLTRLAKRNNGKFERDKVHRMIDGRDPLKGHGGPDMPIWGDAFKRSGDGYSEKAVKARIDALVDHLERLQVK